jgi:hypothetical protein
MANSVVFLVLGMYFRGFIDLLSLPILYYRTLIFLNTMNILEQVFSKREQVHLLRFFLFHPDEDFTFAELRSRIAKRSSVKQAALNQLHKLDCLIEGRRDETREVTYHINKAWPLFNELRSLFVKSQLLVEHDLVRRLERAGQIKLLVLTGVFVGKQNDVTDVLVVGTVNHTRVARILKAFEQDFDQEVRYTILSNNEYHFRKNVGDRFLYNILENRHLVVLDKAERAKETKKKTASAKKRRL